MNRRVRQVLEAVASNRVDREAVARATWLLAEERHRKQRKAARTLPDRKADKAAADQAREIRDRVRSQVMARADGQCEACRCRPVDAMEWHHLLPGPARRRYEATSTTMALCLGCHRAWHRGDVETLQRTLEWAKENGTTMVVQAIERRITKIHAVRAP